MAPGHHFKIGTLTQILSTGLWLLVSRSREKAERGCRPGRAIFLFSARHLGRPFHPPAFGIPSTEMTALLTIILWPA
jgi:hypothetical protein